MAEESRYKIPLFDGSNYDNWKFRMETHLDEFEFLDFIETPLAELLARVNKLGLPNVQEERECDLIRKRDKKCKSAIIQRIADNQLEYVKDSKTSFDIWKVLRDTFARKGIASQLLIRKRLLTMKFSPGDDTLEAHFLRFDKLVRDLKSTGATLEENDVVCHLLLTMPDEYDVVVTAIETLAEGNLTLTFVKNRLLDEQAKRLDTRQDGELQPSAVFSAPTQRRKWPPNEPAGRPNQFKRNPDRKQYLCHNCGGFGHFRKDCRKPLRNRQQQKEVHLAANSADKEEEDEEHSYNFFAGEEHSETRNWFLDSGASEHLVSSYKCLTDVTSLDQGILIKSAKKGATLMGTKRGNVHVQTIVDGRPNRITIQNALYVPGLQFNLLSVSVLEKNGYTVTFEHGKGTVQKDGKILAIATRKHKLYEIVFLPVHESANICEMQRSSELWHRRLGHIGQTSLVKLQAPGGSSSGGGEQRKVPGGSSSRGGEQYPQPVLRRSTRTRTPPNYLTDYVVLALGAEMYVEDLPASFAEIQRREDAEHWYKAVDEELAALDENRTWTLSSLPTGKKAINNKWVFKQKRDEKGDIVQYKARLVAKGCSQRKGFDYDEVYAPVARLTTLRTLLAIINNEDLHTRQMDVKNAFLHGKLQEEIYMKLPEGLDNGTGQVCKLDKTLYGLKQASRAWNQVFDTVVRSHGFVQSELDKCLYKLVHGQEKVFLLVYVDDILMASNERAALDRVVSLLQHKFRMKDLGDLRMFLGIKVQRTKLGMMLCQPTYIQNLLERFGMEECKGAHTPMNVKPAEDTDGDVIIDDKPYRQLIGCLMYAMLTTRPDISASVNFYSRFQSNATEEQWNGLKTILRYLQQTKDFGLFFPKHNSTPLVGYADSDWAGSADRKSVSGYLFQVFGATVSWTTKKQTTVALSSTEAEYVALATACTELIWLRGIMEELEISCSPPITVFEDNQSCIHLLQRWQHNRLKHIDVKFNFVRDLQMTHQIEVKYIRTNDQVADILTKGLHKRSFQELRSRLGVQQL